MKQRAVSKKEALSIIGKLKSGKSSVQAEARRLGVYHATVRKELRRLLGSKEYARLMGPDRCPGQPRKVTKREALSIIAKIRAGRSTIAEETRRLGVNYETVRSAMRDAIGSEQYAKLAIPRSRPGMGSKLTSPTKPSRKETPYSSHRKVATFSHVEDDFSCGRCGTPQLKAGTDGNGGGILWCSCGWSRAIPRVRATAANRE